MGLPSRSTIKSPKNVSPSGNRRLQRIFSCILKDLNLHIISFLFPTKKNKSRQMESGRFAFHGLRLFSILSRPKTVWKTWGKPCSSLQYSTLSVRYYMGRHSARIFLAPSYDCCYDNLNEIHKKPNKVLLGTCLDLGVPFPYERAASKTTASTYGK